MRRLVRQRRVIAFRVAEAIDARHMDLVARHDVAGAVAAMHDLRARRREERLGAFDALHGLALRIGLRIEMRGQAVDLLDIENRITLHEGNGALGFLARRGVRLGAGDFVGVNDKAPGLALPHMRVECEGLLEGHPYRCRIAFLHRPRP